MSERLENLVEALLQVKYQESNERIIMGLIVKRYRLYGITSMVTEAILLILILWRVW